MPSILNPVLVVPIRLWWKRRSIGVAGLVATFVGAFFVMGGGTLLSPQPLTMEQRVLFGVIFLFAAIYLIPATLRINRVGIFREGLAPPMKPLWAMAREPYVIPWEDIASLKLTPEHELDKPPRRYTVTVVLTSGLRIPFTSETIGQRFKSEVQARRFYSVLAVVAQELTASGTVLVDPADPRVAQALSVSGPEGGMYRRTLASKVGITLGGATAVIAAVLYRLGPAPYWNVWLSTMYLGGVLFLWSLLSSNFLKGLSRRIRG
ncbi:MAG: hypothetical protein E6K17_06360 [Methanobacteriota archaeon]|nr:MAG: hypothetical protein E6K17_06360 [Euryarchaeota archaeon]